MWLGKAETSGRGCAGCEIPPPPSPCCLLVWGASGTFGTLPKAALRITPRGSSPGARSRQQGQREARSRRGSLAVRII